MPLSKLVSGGQTGVDRGALDAALDAGLDCGGWCPEGREAEDGIIPARYPLTELPGAGYPERTLQNVIDSDATLIIYFTTLHGGTEQTLRYCIRQHRPYHLIDGAALSHPRAAVLARAFIVQHGIAVLNVAGPRASQSPEGYDYAYAAITGLVCRRQA